MNDTAQTVVCVGVVVRHGDRILLVRQSKGHSLEGQWTVPWGHLENLTAILILRTAFNTDVHNRTPPSQGRTLRHPRPARRDVPGVFRRP